VKLTAHLPLVLRGKNIWSFIVTPSIRLGLHLFMSGPQAQGRFCLLLEPDLKLSLLQDDSNNVLRCVSLRLY
jgi:hypothetical protein